MLGTDGISDRMYNRAVRFGQTGYVGPPPVSHAPVCRKYERCAGCPYPRHGFVCWNRDGSCLRTEMAEIYEKERMTRK